MKKQKMIADMIAIYCRGHKHSKGSELCSECAALLDFARGRAAQCPHKEERGFCGGCPTPCYGKHREDIKRVMRYAGPRMIFHHPTAVLRHAMHGLGKKQ